MPNNTCRGTSVSFYDEKNLIMEKLPYSVDLREWGLIGKALDQGSCGSCWAMSTRYLMHSLVLHDIMYYRELYP